jgi:hypothetical protein
MERAAVNKEQRDSFYEGLMDVQTQLCQSYADEVGRLRLRVKELQATIDTYPATASDLQDRLTMAETEIQRLRASSEGSAT